MVLAASSSAHSLLAAPCLLLAAPCLLLAARCSLLAAHSPHPSPLTPRQALLEWTKVAACAERPVGVLFWKFGDAAANWISRNLVAPPDAPPPKAQTPPAAAAAAAAIAAATAAGEAADATTDTGGATTATGEAGAASAGRRRPLVLFDGVCLLCSRFIHFVLDHDNEAAFDFAPLQSELAQARSQLTSSTDCLLTIYVRSTHDFAQGLLALLRAWTLNPTHTDPSPQH